MDRRSRRIRCRSSQGRPWLVAGTLAVLLTLATSGRAAEDDADVKSGLIFRRELQRPINIYRRAVSVREMTRRLEALHGVAIVLDRRIDPDHVLDVQLTQVTLREGLDLFAGQFGADAAVIGSTIVIGPPDSLDRMRTDSARQVADLRTLEGEETRERTIGLVVAQTFRWDDLQTPRELLLEIAERFDVTVANPDLIPHDLWAGGVLSDVNALEAFAIIVGQFDLSFSWSPEASTIELTESPERLTIEGSYKVRADRDESAIKMAEQECPRAQFRRDGRRLHVVATVGEHERIAAILAPEDQGPQPAAPDFGPLSNRTFTLTIERAPAVAVLRTLEAQGIVVDYDPAALESAGIDLNQKISLALEGTSADAFFQAVCGPLGLTFEIEGKTVRLMPR